MTDSLTSAAVNGHSGEIIVLTSVDLFTVAGMLLLVILSGLITASRSGLAALTPADTALLSRKKRNDNRVLLLLERKRKISAAILTAVTFLNVTIILLFVWLLPGVFHPALTGKVGFITLLLLIFAVILIFCEIIPKICGNLYPMAIVRLMALPLLLLEQITAPVIYFLFWMEGLFERRTKPQRNISVDEISHALELTSESPIPEDKEILEGIVNFGNKSVGEIMCPRVDVVAIDIKSSFTRLLELINNSGYSRIPVYSESFDQVKGILFIKDLLPFTDNNADFKWQGLLRPPFFVPETKKVKDLLEDFQKNKVHLAVVVDEYGGSSGIVTLEDVLEEIVGEISDEFDEEEMYFTRIGEKKFLFDGKIPLADFFEVIGCRDNYFDEVKGDADTLAGLILEIKGEIPVNHEKVEFRDYRFTVESISSRRIRQVKVEMK